MGGSRQASVGSSEGALVSYSITASIRSAAPQPPIARLLLLLEWLAFTIVLGSTIGFVSVLFHWSVHILAVVVEPTVCPNYTKEESDHAFCHAWHGSTPVGLFILFRSISVIFVATLASYLSIYVPEINGGGILPVKICLAVGAPVPFKIGVLRFIVSAVYLGSGNPLGAETPTLHYACAVACVLYTLVSRVGNRDFFPEECKTSMVLMGCVCGLAAAFNSVLAGVVFHIEHFSHGNRFMEHRVLLFYSTIACLASSLVSRLMWANITPNFHNGIEANVKHDSDIVRMGNTIEVEQFSILYLVVLAMVAGVIFGTLAHAFLVVTAKMREVLISFLWVPCLGLTSGILTSILAGICFFVTGFDGVWGVGWESLGRILVNSHSVEHRIIFLVAKFFACCGAVSCGGNGGIFGPALVIGGAAGSVLASLFKEESLAFKVLPVLGMCGVFSGIHRLPLTAVIICYEFVELGATSDNLIFLMLGVSFVAELTATELSKSDIFDVIIRQDGLDPECLVGANWSKSQCLPELRSQPSTYGKLFNRTATSDSFVAPPTSVSSNNLKLPQVIPEESAPVRDKRRNSSAASVDLMNILSRRASVATPDPTPNANQSLDAKKGQSKGLWTFSEHVNACEENISEADSDILAPHTIP